jgi:2-isopropylmalate synthase
MPEIIIYDTTLRDGEQAPGFSMSAEEKLHLALQLEKLNVDFIEAGYPACSVEEIAACQMVALQIRHSRLAFLSRALRADIDKCRNLLKHTTQPRLHIFSPCSDLHLIEKLQISREDNLQRIYDSIQYARNICDDIQFGCEDATRAESAYLYQVIETAIKAGARTITIADTVGYVTPWQFEKLITDILTTVQDMEKATLSVHCHNDLGLAVSNSLAGILAGAGQVECTINGIGERAGNAALEEVVMVLVKNNLFKSYQSRVVTNEIWNTSCLLEKITGLGVQVNKAIVGKNAFKHESGIHQHGLSLNRLTYEFISPEEIGRQQQHFVIGKHSGVSGLLAVLKELSLEIPDKHVNELLLRCKKLGIKKEVDKALLQSLIAELTDLK